MRKCEVRSAEHPAGACIGTHLLWARDLGQRLGLSRLHLKLEGNNPTGSQKDRAAAAVVQAARAQRSPGVAVGTCGNLGAAIARACFLQNVPCAVFIPANYCGHQQGYIRETGASLYRVGNTYEDAVEAASKFSAANGYFDGSPSRYGGAIAMASYARIAEEILLVLGKAPATTWVPVGNGTTLAGMHAGFRSMGAKTRMGAVGSLGNTAAIESAWLRREVELDRATLRANEINEPLVNWRSCQAGETVETVMKSEGWAVRVTDEELVAASALVQEQTGIPVPPACAAGIAGLLSLGHEIDPEADHVVVLTGGSTSAARRHRNGG